MTLSTDTKETIELDRIKLNAMKLRVIQLEKVNVKTKKYTKDEMIEQIRNIITTEINKNI
ncbi:hypothetical protein ACFSFY_12520 [Sporosarcina siberiensis]|uniref:Uncharacterized protein n=1 Tax=Sporosarcina siberiensis TaxID=1365606 RepID=A0ABW4SK32_9BACL